MLQTVLLLAFCLFMGLLSLAACVWVVASGQLLTIDGLLLISVSLTLGAFFMFNLGWSVHTGEFREALNYLRKRSTKSNT